MPHVSRSTEAFRPGAGAPPLRRRAEGRPGAAHALVVLLAMLGCGGDSFTWKTASAESQGLDGPALEAWADGLAASGTASLLLVRNDRLVLERHRGDRTRESGHYAASVAKGVVGGLGVALLVSEGRLELDGRAARYLPAWREHPARSEITIRELGAHVAGLESADLENLPPERREAWMEAFWERDRDPTSVRIALEETPLVARPGERLHYSSPGFAALSAALASALERAGKGSLRERLRVRIFEPLGLERKAWSLGYGRPFEWEGREVWATWGGATFTPDALARVGRLLLREGEWEGERLLAAGAVESMRTALSRPERPAQDAWPAPAVGWWTNASGTWPELPRDAFLAAGAGHQILLVVPSWRLVVVRMGEPLGESEWGQGYWRALHADLLRPLARAVPDAPAR